MSEQRRARHATSSQPPKTRQDTDVEPDPPSSSSSSIGPPQDTPMTSEEARAAFDRIPVVDEPDETPPVEYDPTALLLRRVIKIVAVVALVVIGAVTALAIYTIPLVSAAAADRSAEGIAANRQRASSEVRGNPTQSCDPALPESVTLECANRDLRRAGIPEVVDPDGLGPSQVAALAGEARARLWYAQQGTAAREAPRQGVISPPTSGRFPEAR